MIKKLLVAATLLGSVYAQDEIKYVDCLIIKKENSIICKYMNERSEEDRNIDVKWIDPDGNVSRERTILISKGHGSVYDFRYIQGRKLGTWEFVVNDADEQFSTSFELKEEDVN